MQTTQNFIAITPVCANRLKNIKPRFAERFRFHQWSVSAPESRYMAVCQRKNDIAHSKTGVWHWSDLEPVSVCPRYFAMIGDRQIWWSLEAAGFVFDTVWSIWNLSGTAVALLPRRLSNFKAMR